MNLQRTQRPTGFKPAEISARINRDVVSQHADNAAFLWAQRDDAVGNSRYNLDDLSRLDERLEANLDGLRTAGDVGWRACVERLAEHDPGAVFSAGVLAFQDVEPSKVQVVINEIDERKEVWRAVASGFGWMRVDRIESLCRDLLTSDRPGQRWIGVSALAAHRRDPGSELRMLISDRTHVVRARALRAAGEFGRVDLIPYAFQYVSDSDDVCRFWSTWTCIRLGDHDSNLLAKLWGFVVGGSVFATRALDLLFRVAPPQQTARWWEELNSRPETARLAAIGAGVRGDPQFVQAALVLMNNPIAARAAGDAFCSITGLDLSLKDYEGNPPEAAASMSRTAEELEGPVQDSDEPLRWPNPPSIALWWRTHKGEFKDGRRYLCGQEVNEESMRAVLRRGNQRQRRAAALELALRTPKSPLFEVRARAVEQVKAIGSWSS